MAYDIYGRPLKPKRQSIAKSQKDIVWDNQKGKCFFCPKKLCPSFTHYDHIKEVHRGGKSITKNLRALCADCHSKRHKEDQARKADKKKSRRKSNVSMFGNPKMKSPDICKFLR